MSSQKRIDESVMRILTAKARAGLATKKLVDLETVHSVVNSPESNAVAQQISDRSVTLVRNPAVPLRMGIGFSLSITCDCPRPEAKN